MGRVLATLGAALTLLLAMTATAPAQDLLGRGSTGSDVRQWQQKLNLDEVPGSDIAVDGIFGPVTENKTKRFQNWRGITVDGIVGSQTRSAMRQTFRETTGQVPADDATATRPLLSRGTSGPGVERWQGRLNNWLSTARPEQGQLAEDGIFGPKTERATRDFQDAADIAVDGVVGPNTRRALTRETADT